MIFASILLVSAMIQDESRLVLEYPNGKSRIEVELKRDLEGNLMFDGDFDAWHENGVKRTSGPLAQGLRHKRWVERHENGEAKESGYYIEGLRNQRWRTFDRSGHKLSEGDYSRGSREGKWKFWDTDGVLDEQRSGNYTVVRDQHVVGGMLRDQRHGAWLEAWPNGSRREAGIYEYGERVGEWRFWHADGTFDPEFLSGQYVKGRRVRAARDSWQPVTTDYVLVPPQSTSLVSVAEEFEFGEGPDPLGLASLTKETREAHLLELAERGPALFRELLLTWMHLDLADADHLLVGATCNDLLALAMFGARIDWRMAVDAPTQQWNRREILRLLHVWDRARDFPQFWTLDVAARGDSKIVTRDWPRFEENLRTVDEGLDFTRVSVNLVGPAQTLHGALNWLVAHQAPDGSWSSADFAAQCKHKSGVCDGPGHGHHDVGVTGLALLALVRSGSTSTRGSYSDAVRRGVVWLMTQQDLHGGRFCDWTAPPAGTASARDDYIPPLPPRGGTDACTTCDGRGFMTPGSACPGCGGSGKRNLIHPPPASRCRVCAKTAARGEREPREFAHLRRVDRDARSV